MTVLYSLLALYILIGLGFCVAMAVEAPKHGAQFGLVNVAVAIAWPIWGVWYVWVLASERFRK